MSELRDTSSEWVIVGERIRAAREDANMSVRELAKRIGVSSSHVSQVERGLASFSVRALYNVVSELGISMDSLFAETETETEPAPPDGGSDDGSRRHASHDRDPLETAGIVLRRASRPHITLPRGTRWERLTARPEPNAEFIEVFYPPSTTDEPPADFNQHNSREYGVVVEGSLTIEVGFDRTVLHVGDSIVFESHVPHRYWNATADPVRAVWFIQNQHGPASDSFG